MKRLLTAIVFFALLSVHAAAPLRGADRLRELVVFPGISLGFNLGIDFHGNQWVFMDNENQTDEISRLRQELKPHPDDIKLLLRLGNLLDDDNETNESETIYLQVEKLCRKKIAVNPQDGLTLLELGEALHELDRDGEAGQIYHQATMVSSNEWRCWVGLGNFLSDQVFSFFPRDLRHQIYPLPSQEALNYRPSPEALKKSEDSLAEAARCFDQALSLAPRESELYFQRAGFMSISNRQSCFVRHVRDQETIDSSGWLAAIFPKETIANMRKATELNPKNYEYAGLAVYFEFFNAEARIKGSDHSFKGLPGDTQQSIRQDLTPLENLARDPDKKTAAGALENMGLLNLMMGDEPAASVDFHHAVTSDPTREESWDLLLESLMEAGLPEDVAATCQDRLKIQNTAHNHIILGKAYVKMGQWNKANEQAELALQMETNNVIPEIMLAAIALRESKPDDDLTVANTHLQQASTLIKTMPDGDEKTGRGRELLLDIAIYYALRGEPDKARAYVDEIAKHYPDDETVKEISDALN